MFILLAMQEDKAQSKLVRVFILAGQEFAVKKIARDYWCCNKAGQNGPSSYPLDYGIVVAPR